MSRNGSGTYTKVNTFSSGATITAAGHNQNWDDVATEMTNSVAADGQTSMTGPLKAANGSTASPAFTFASDTNTGFIRSAADSVGVIAGGTQVGQFLTTGLVFTNATIGTLEATATATFGGPISVSATASFKGPIIASATAAFVTGFIASATCTFTGGLIASATAAFTTKVTVGNGFTVSAGDVSFPTGSIASTALASIITRGTAQATTSGSNIDFTSIPSTVTQITVTFSAVSLTTGATSPIQIQIGDSGGVETTGYLSHGGFLSGTNTGANFSSTGGFALTNNITAGVDVNGSFTLTLVDASTNTWAGHGVVATSAAGYYSGGSKSLSATLDRIRITSSSDTFDAGKVNIVYA